MAVKHSDRRYAVDGHTYRVVIVDDVVALPDEQWAMGSFTTGISVEWMLHSGKLPGGRENRRVLARVVRQALADHHARPETADQVEDDVGPQERP